MCVMCSGGSRSELMAMLRHRILTYGYAIIDVTGDGPANPPFSYTVGLSRVGHPELICFGGHPDCEYHALDALARLVRAGGRFDEGSALDDVYGPSGRGGRLLRFPDSSTHLLLANELYRAPEGPPVPSLQLVWPEREPLLSQTLPICLDGDQPPWA